MADPVAYDTNIAYATLFPHPLSVNKKPRRATFRQRILPRSVLCESSDHFVFGPLDDIIDVIKSDLWSPLLKSNVTSDSFDWDQSSTASPLWAVTPLPLSRNPSEQPPTIRKSRHSRSSASDSSMDSRVPGTRKGSLEEKTDGGPVGSVPWPLLTTSTPYRSDDATALQISSSPQGLAAQQVSQDSAEKNNNGVESKKRHPYRLRLFSNGFNRKRWLGGGNTGAGDNGGAPLDSADKKLKQRLSDEEEICNRVQSVAKHMPHVTELDPALPTADAAQELPTTLKASVNIMTDLKVLTAEREEVDVVIDIEGLLHNRKPLWDTQIDVIFLIDNGFYVTKSCLERALDAVTGALLHMGRGDRLALYTTHCVHHDVTGIRPDLLFPLRQYSADVEIIIDDLNKIISSHGVQGWMPVRPNPAMIDVLLSIVRSLIPEGLRRDRTHVILLSPMAHALHGISRTFPGLYIHQINPAILPFHRDPEHVDTVCYDACCKNVYTSNAIAYEAVPARIKRILRNARLVMPVSELTKVSIDLRPRDGCELLEQHGTSEIPRLRPGQTHTLFARILVTKSMTKEVDLESDNPLLNSSLAIRDIRQELQTYAVRDATKVHILDVQVLAHDSLHTSDNWTYFEAPLLLFRELGTLAYPLHAAAEVYKRKYFSMVNQDTTQASLDAANALLATLDRNNEPAHRLVDRMLWELYHHKDIRDYERQYRQRLPLCPGPVDIEGSPHDWLPPIWERPAQRRRATTTQSKARVEEIN